MGEKERSDGVLEWWSNGISEFRFLPAAQCSTRGRARYGRIAHRRSKKQKGAKATWLDHPGPVGYLPSSCVLFTQKIACWSWKVQPRGYSVTPLLHSCPVLKSNRSRLSGRMVML
jgi:hypothetical protein